MRQDLAEWLKWLRNVGYDGWRFDYVKGYSGEFTRKYIDASVPLMAFGEYWDSCSYTGGVLDYNQDVHRQRTVNWCDKTGGTAAAFDFTTKGILQEAVGRNEYWRLIDSKGQPPGMLGMWGSRAVTFIENHDTGSTLGHWRATPLPRPADPRPADPPPPPPSAPATAPLALAPCVRTLSVRVAALPLRAGLSRPPSWRRDTHTS